MPRCGLLSSALILAGLVGCGDDLATSPDRRLAPRTDASFAVTPTNGGLITAPVATIGPGRWPRLGGDVACFTGNTDQFRYYRFSTAATTEIPGVSPNADHCAISGNLIALDRTITTWVENTVSVFDIATQAETQLEPGRVAARNTPAIGGNTVAFFDYNYTSPGTFTTTTLRVVDLATPAQSQILSSGALELLPNLSRDGNLLVWQAAGAVMKAVRSAGVWSEPQTVSSGCSEDPPDTDGTYIVWAATCDDETDIYFQLVSSGAITRLSLAGADGNPRVDAGIIAFPHWAAGDPFANGDIMVYNIATNTLLQVSNTSAVNDQRPDVRLVAGGNIRVVWDGSGNVYGTTFTPTGGPVGTSFTFGGFGGSLKAPPVLNRANRAATLPVNFSLGGDQGLNIFAAGSPSSVEINCKTLVVVGTSETADSRSQNALVYNAATNTYTYKWSTATAWGGTCRRFTMQFVNGASAFLYFQFN